MCIYILVTSTTLSANESLQLLKMILDRIPDNLSPEISPYLLRHTILFLNQYQFLNQLLPMTRQSLPANAQPFNLRPTDVVAIEQILPDMSVQPDTQSIEVPKPTFSSNNLPKSTPAPAAKPKASSSTRMKLFIPSDAMSYGAIYAGGNPVPPAPSSMPSPPKFEEKPVIQQQPSSSPAQPTSTAAQVKKEPMQQSQPYERKSLPHQNDWHDDTNCNSAPTAPVSTQSQPKPSGPAPTIWDDNSD